MQLVIRTVTEARQAALDEPKRWNAAVYQGSETPLSESATTQVHLFHHVKTANEKLRELVSELEQDGYKRVQWGVSHGIVKLERGSDVVWLGLDKRKRRTA